MDMNVKCIYPWTLSKSDDLGVPLKQMYNIKVMVCFQFSGKVCLKSDQFGCSLHSVGFYFLRTLHFAKSIQIDKIFNVVQRRVHISKPLFVYRPLNQICTFSFTGTVMHLLFIL